MPPTRRHPPAAGAASGRRKPRALATAARACATATLAAAPSALICVCASPGSRVGACEAPAAFSAMSARHCVIDEGEGCPQRARPGGLPGQAGHGGPHQNIRRQQGTGHQPRHPASHRHQHQPG
jgi:hypothetical protein